ncbi:MAG: UDP-glucose 4-epimerase GalE [Alphaproteobacteria bacterium]|nr:UDP-glucose 4-epimerase GalE [Alphaproteobacteria bacterium]
MTVLVTGGAGYVGAHMLLALEAAGETAVAIDDLSSGAVWLAPSPGRLFVGDVGDRGFVSRIIDEYGVTEIVHFASATLVPESIEKPLDYYRRNAASALALFETCVAKGVDRIILSSTASVYGKPDASPVSESAPVRSISPFGASMAMAERMLTDAAAAHGLNYVILRYFNVAGADPALRAGQIGKATHLVRVAAQIAVGARDEELRVFGTDYQTPDGTAIRDYVHVCDLADAHLAALMLLRAGEPSAILNCGYGRGYSVREVVAAVERVTGAALPTVDAPRRAGDPPQLIADSAAIRSRLDWRPRFDEIDIIVSGAIDWERRLHVAGAT